MVGLFVPKRKSTLRLPTLALMVVERKNFNASGRHVITGVLLYKYLQHHVSVNRIARGNAVDVKMNMQRLLESESVVVEGINGNSGWEL